jgi:hypothetical protein
VQAAVNQGGRVLLAATDAGGKPTAFNFGPAAPQASGGRGVDITGNVTVIGEHSDAGVVTIIGGDVPFFVQPAANVTVAGITFEAPFYDAILLDDPSSAEVTGNRIEHVVGRFVSPSVGYANGIDESLGGNITIAGNVIDDVNAPFAHGILQFAARGDVLIAGNQVSRTQEIAIESTGNAGRTRIVDNTVAPGPQRYQRGAAGTGIEANGPGSYKINDNSATCVNPNAICVFVFGATGFFNFQPVIAPVIKDNQIIAGADGVDGIGLLGQVSRGYVADNEITGIGEAAFVVVGAACCSGNNLFANTFAGNDIENFTSTFADVYMDQSTHDNVFKGDCRTVLDLGTANQITCESEAHAQHQAAATRQVAPPSKQLETADQPNQASTPQRP